MYKRQPGINQPKNAAQPGCLKGISIESDGLSGFVFTFNSIVEKTLEVEKFRSEAASFYGRVSERNCEYCKNRLAIPLVELRRVH